MKKLIIGVLLIMTSCHADRFAQIDAILFDQQQQIDALAQDLEDQGLQLQDKIDYLSENLESVSDNLTTSIDSLSIEVNENDKMILGIISDTIEYMQNSFIELNDRITLENQLLNDAINLNAENIAAIELSIIELEGELDLAIGELNVVITALVQELHGELLTTVAEVLREYLTAEYQQIVVEVNNNITENTENDTTQVCTQIDGFVETTTSFGVYLRGTDTLEEFQRRMRLEFNCN